MHTPASNIFRLLNVPIYETPPLPVALTVLFQPPQFQPPPAATLAALFFSTDMPGDGVGVGVFEPGLPTAPCCPLITRLMPSNLLLNSSNSCFATASAVFAFTSSNNKASLSVGALFSVLERTCCVARLEERLLNMFAGAWVDFWEGVRPRRNSLSPLEMLSAVVDLLSVGGVSGELSACVQDAAAEFLRAFWRSSWIAFSCF